MKSIAITVLFVLVFFAASNAAAADYADLYIIPAAGHAHGAFGTLWRSDVVLHNIQPVPITVEIATIESGQAPSKEPIAVTVGGAATLHLNPGETRTLSDVVGNLGRDVSGALIIGADLPFAVTSRTWAEVSGDRTLGQTVFPIAIAGSADAVHDTAVLPSLETSAGHRANIGMFVAASHAPLTVEVTLLSESGAELGSHLVVLDEPGFVHRQFAVATAERVTAVIRIVEGEGIAVPYASIIDNRSAEAVFLPGEAISAGGMATRRMIANAVRSLSRAVEITVAE